MTIKKQGGFTLIELLVVIAIIGILAGILVVAINPKKQMDKSKDGKIKAQLANLRTQSALTFAEDENYTNVCTDASAIVTDLGTYSGNCYATDAAWAAWATLPDDTHEWCVDSNGYSGVSTSARTAGSSTDCTS